MSLSSKFNNHLQLCMPQIPVLHMKISHNSMCNSMCMRVNFMIVEWILPTLLAYGSVSGVLVRISMTTLMTYNFTCQNFQLVYCQCWTTFEVSSSMWAYWLCGQTKMSSTNSTHSWWYLFYFHQTSQCSSSFWTQS